MEEPLRPGFFTADMVRRVKISMGINALDNLLGGGAEAGLTHLFYGDRCLYDDFLKCAVNGQMPKEKGGTDSPVIIIDSANMIKIERLTDISYELDLDPEEVMDRIYISRAFNASQTYDLVMNELEGFFKRLPARILMVTGLPNLFIEEGLTSEGLQQISHMASRLMTFTLKRDLFTFISAPASQKSVNNPAGGRSLASNCQVHVRVEESRSYVRYSLTKHPQYPVRSISQVIVKDRGGTLPLSYFLRGNEEERET
jgi:RecA/RadA recombinase